MRAGAMDARALLEPALRGKAAAALGADALAGTPKEADGAPWHRRIASPDSNGRDIDSDKMYDDLLKRRPAPPFQAQRLPGGAGMRLPAGMVIERAVGSSNGSLRGTVLFELPASISVAPPSCEAGGSASFFETWNSAGLESH